MTEDLTITSAGAAVFDTNTGQVVGKFGSSGNVSIPALLGGAGYYADAGKLTAFDVASGETLWTLGDGSLSIPMPPVVINGTVYVVARSATNPPRYMLLAFDRVSGEMIWSAESAPIQEPSSGVPTTGMAAGDGLLVVPVGDVLIAFVPAAIE